MQCGQGARQKRDRRRHPRVNHLCGVVILAWLFPLAALLLAVLPAARAPQKRVSHFSPGRSRSIWAAGHIHSRTVSLLLNTHAQPVQRPGFLSAGDCQKYIHQIHLVCRSCNRPFPPSSPNRMTPSNVRMTQPAPGPVDPGISLGRPPFHWLC
jgi:hypothetical protein